MKKVTNPQTFPVVKDHVNFKSDDGLVEIITKVDSALRFPKHDYPVVCLRLRPKPGSRIQAIDDGSGGLDVLLRHDEFAAHIRAVNQADPKAGYAAPDVPAKCKARKEHWDAVNAERWRLKR